MTADSIGGVWTYALELARGLEPYDVTVALATMGSTLSPQLRHEAQRVANIELFESAFKLEWMEDPWREVQQAGEWLLELEAQLNPDIIHLNGYVHGALPWRHPVLVVGHSCVLSWWQAVQGEPAPLTWNHYRQQVTRGLRVADLVVTPTQAMLAELDKFYGPLPPSRVIHNGRDFKQFVPTTKEPFALCIGRLWDEAKNVAALERIAPELVWPVYVAGSTQHPEGGSLRAGQLHALGHLDSHQLKDWLGRAAIYVLPARYEPFGLSALEAALSGCALVLSDIPSLREVWGEAATFVPLDDDAALTSTLNTLMQDQSRRLTLGQQARARALEFSLKRMAESYFGVYQDLLPDRALTTAPRVGELLYF
ncbi:MAG: glycosyltransferase family 4 protein [Abitibacteriaceae bacterium]|nr:glycosyltransferase family 4 protein [Abditibacteriaceae bacterium]MBV9866242.1 glycosyltransferase family 4 protein [Abditibacteriaceae bacterium]